MTTPDKIQYFFGAIALFLIPFGIPIYSSQFAETERHIAEFCVVTCGLAYWWAVLLVQMAEIRTKGKTTINIDFRKK